MGLFGKILNLTVDVVSAPIALAEDVIDAVTSECDDETHTEKKVKSIIKNADKILDDVFGGGL